MAAIPRWAADAPRLAAPPSVLDVLRSPGEPLDAGTRSWFEPRLGMDLGSVQVHHDSGQAAGTARTMRASAYTVGQHVVFGEGKYVPASLAGRELLAHELTHVAQQRDITSMPGSVPVGRPGDQDEVAADDAARALLRQRPADPRPGAAAVDTGPARLRPVPIQYGNGPRLQRSPSPEDSDIGPLPIREEYERRGELLPRALENIVQSADTRGAAGPIDLRPPGWQAELASQADRAAEALGAGGAPLPAGVGQPAPPLSASQLRARLDVLEIRQRQIEELLTDLDPGSGHETFTAAAILAARWSVDRPPGQSPFVLVMPGLDPADMIPDDPAALAQEIARAEAIQTRSLDALAELKATRENEQRADGSLEDYPLDQALREIDETRRAYRDATDRILTPRAVTSLKKADDQRTELRHQLVSFRLQYFESRASKRPEVQSSLADMHQWAGVIESDLWKLQDAAAALRAARSRGDPQMPAIEQAFVRDANLIQVSIEALGEWDTAVSAFEFLTKNSALWGTEGVGKIVLRMRQMRDAAFDKDLSYLELLLRDHRADPAVRDFYQSLPSVVAWSHFIIGLAITLVATIATAGVGLAISAAGTATAAALTAGLPAAEAAATASVILNTTFVIKLGGEALVFTIISRQLSSLVPGMEPASPFWAEFFWNLGMFTVMHGASAVSKGLIEGFAVNRAVLQTAINVATSYAALEAFGWYKFAIEEGRPMTLGEFGGMSGQNVVMAAAMAVAMKPFNPLLAGLERSLTSNFGRFAARFGPLAGELAGWRNALEVAAHQRMLQKPQAGPAELTDLMDEGALIDGALNDLNERVLADPAIDVNGLGDELRGVIEQARVTSVAQLLSGLDNTVDLQPTGDESSWSLAAGHAGELAGYLRDNGYTVTSESPLSGGNAAVEAVIPGKGTVTFVERPAEAPGKPAGEAAAADSARVKWLLELSARLAKSRAAMREAAAGEAGVEAAEPSGVERAHAQAVDIAMQDVRAEAGLRRLATRFGPMYRTALARVLAAVPPENMAGFLRAVADPKLGGLSPEFYEALGRNGAACRLVEGYGGQVLLDVARLQRGDSIAVRLARARVDIDRVLAGLDQAAAAQAAGGTAAAGGTVAAGPEDMVAEIHRSARHRSTFRALDRVVGPRPEPGVQIEPDLTDPLWRDYQRRANEYARTHPPEGGALDPGERELRAALIQTVERARAGEYAHLDGPGREALLKDFEALAEAVRMDRGWLNSTKGLLNEALQLGYRQPSVRTVWLEGRLAPRGPAPTHSTIPDEAIPRVTPEEIADRSVERKPRTWIERKNYTLGSAGGRPDVPNLDAVGAAAQHFNEAIADLGNLPPGSTIAVEYARDPGPATRKAMADKLYRDPRIVRVTFAGRAVPRAR